MVSLSVDFGGSSIKLAAVEHGEVLRHSSVPNSNSLHLLDTVAAAARELAPHPLDGVGIAMPGIIDPQRGTLAASNGKYAALIGIDLKLWAAEHLSIDCIQVMVENDARAALVGEMRFGQARGYDDVVLVILGTGIGCAVSMSGRLLTGRHGRAGVLGGHLTVDLDGPACNCGNYGCCEAIAGTWALSRTWAAVTASSWEGSTPLTYRELLDRRSSGEPAAEQVWQRVTSALRAMIIDHCHTFDPQLVILAGAPLQHPHFDVANLQATVHSRIYVDSYRPPLVIARHPALSVVLGLHALVTEHITEELS